MQLDKAIKSRKSVRRFLSKKPDWRKIIDAIDAARYAPMAGGIFSLRFVLVNDEKKIDAIGDATQQDFVRTAQYLLVACSRCNLTVNAFGKKGEIYCRQQAGAALQNFMLKITEAGLGTCWIGHFDEDEVKRTLHIPDDVNVEVIFPIGNEFGFSKPKRGKVDLDTILYFNRYKQRKMKLPKRTTV